MARIVFMGTPDFAVPLVEACSRLGELVAAVTQPDRPKGRGNDLAAPPVKEWAVAHGIPVWQPVKIKTGELEAQLRAATLEVGVVAAYGRILPKGVLEAPRLGCLNLHASLLPKLRGAAPIQWAIANGETETGVCLMQMDEGLDTGPVLARRAIAIAPTDTGGSLHDRLSAVGRELLEAELPRFLRGELTAVPQDHARHTLAPIIEKEQGRLEWQRPAVALERQVRAFDPWPGTFSRVEAKHLKVLRSHVGEGVAGAAPGTVIAATSEGLQVACGEGSLWVTELQLEGRRRMPAADFVAGHPLQAGPRLG